MRVEVGVATDIGQVRDGNEDSFLVEPPLYAVADGMGGHRGGEVASQLALETVEVLFRRGRGSLAEQVREANRAVFERSAEDRAVTGMGTTLTAAVVEGAAAHLAHVGDSRAYLLRAGALRRLTEDHTLVHRMVDAGEISEAEAEVHPHRNVLTRVVGTEPDVAVDVDEIGLLDGDRLLLCSDGLTSMVAEPQIQAILESTPAPQEAADRLVRAANRAGGLDNITVVVLDVHDDDDPAGPATDVPTTTVPAAIGATGGAAGTTGAATAGAATAATEGPSPRPTAARRPARPSRRTLVRAAIAVVAAVVVVGAGVALFRAWLDARWYVGVANDHVAIYQGIPAEILGFDLSTVAVETDIPAEDAAALPLYAGLADGINQNSREDAEALIDRIREDLRAERRADRVGDAGADGETAG
ncbi:MAG TPA: Stp1/IreP family PP2C-type Ser/Thr phosphatase [Actinomycetota bacterium]